MSNRRDMRQCMILLFASCLILLAAFFLYDCRLYATYIDFRDAMHLNCVRCGALGCDHDTLRLFGNHRMPQQMAWSLKHKMPFRKLQSIAIVYEPNRSCKHEWEWSLTAAKEDLHREVFYYPIPQQLYTEYETADRILRSLFLPIVACALCVLSRNYRPTILILRVVCLLFAVGSFCVLVYCSSVRLGTSATALLGDLRKTRASVAGHHESSVFMDRVSYLLSDKPIQDCEQQKDWSRPDSKNERFERSFPLRMIVKDQAWLAVCMAQFDVKLAERYFYGSSSHPEEDFQSLVCLMNKAMRLRMGYKPREEPCIRAVSTNAFGLVTVVWGDGPVRSDMDTYAYAETIFARINSKGADELTTHWIPVSTIDHLHYTYFDMMYEQNSW